LKGQGREGQGNKRDGKGRVEGKERKRGGEKG